MQRSITSIRIASSSRASQPVRTLRAGRPTVIAIHGDADPIVPYEQEVREIEGLKKAGNVAELVTIPGGGHGNFPRDRVLRAWTAIDAFVKANVPDRARKLPSSAEEGWTRHQDIAEPPYRERTGGAGQ